MIDGIKIELQLEDVAALKQVITFRTDINKETGEIMVSNCRMDAEKIQTVYIERGDYRQFELELKRVENTPHTTGQTEINHYLTIKGSLHKYYFDGQNYSPFSFEAVNKAINALCGGLGLLPTECKLSNLEFGVNIQVPFEPCDFLQSNLIAYRNHRFNSYKPDRRGRVIGYECNRLSHYRVKVYDKGRQFDLPYHLMRFELRYLKMEQVNRLGVRTLSDLMNPGVYSKLGERLIKGWDAVVWGEYGLQVCNMTAAERKLYQWGMNPNNWEQFKKEKLYSKIKDRKKSFRKLIAKHGSDWQNRIKKMIIEEWQNLTNQPPKIHPNYRWEKM